MAAFLDCCRFNPTAGGTTDWTYSSAVTGYQSPAAAGVINGSTYSYRAESADLSQWEIGTGSYNTSTGVLTRAAVLFNSSGTTAKIAFSTVPQVAIVALAEDLRIGVIGETILYNQTTAPNNFLIEDGSAYSAVTYAALFAVLVRSATITLTIASPSVISWPGHVLKANDPFFLKAAGGDTLPTGFTAGAVYYVVGSSIVAGSSFQLSATPGGAAIAGTGSQSGTHTGVNAPFGCSADLSTFNVPNTLGEFLRMWDGTRGVDPNRSFGSDQLDAMQGHIHQGTFGSSANSAASTTSYGFTGGSANTSGPVSDGTNGTPRTAAETRPRNQVKLPCIRYQLG